MVITGEASVALTKQRDSRGWFLPGNRCGFIPGVSGNPKGLLRSEPWVTALQDVAAPEAVLDPERIAKALDVLAARCPRAYLRLVEQVWARKLGKAAKNVPKSERTTSPESHVP